MAYRVVFAAAVLLLSFLLAGPALGHGELVASSPQPGETVGSVSHIDLIFSTQVFNFEITVTKPDGSLVEGSAVQKADPYLSFEAVPLSDEGEYIVRYRAVDSDGDLLENAYAFSIAEGAGKPTPLPVDTSIFAEEEDTSIWFYVVLMGGVLVVAVLAGLLAERYRKLRLLRAANDGA